MGHRRHHEPRDVRDLCRNPARADLEQRSEVVILDNLSSHKSPKAAQILRDIGCWFLYLPPYSPDLMGWMPPPRTAS